MAMLNKKGVFFTFITILLLLVILVAFIARTEVSSLDRYQKEEGRVLVLNAFVKSFDAVASKALEASAKQAIYSSQGYMHDQAAKKNNKKQYITLAGSFQNAFSGLILDGKQGNIKLKNMEDSPGQRDALNIKSTLYQLQESVKINNAIILEYQQPTAADIAIVQISPWELEATLNLNNIKVYAPADINNPSFQSSELKWDLGNKQIKAKLYVTDFSDPFSLAEDGLQIPIKKTLLQQFTTKQDLDIFINNHEFLAHKHGPNFLQRMSGDFSDDPLNFGIEAVLDPTTHPNPKSAVDYIYFSANDPVKCQAQGYPNLYFDNQHAQFYTGLPCPAL